MIRFGCQQPRTTQENLKEEQSKLGQHVGVSVGYIALFTLIEAGRLTHHRLPCLGVRTERGLGTGKHTCGC